jgi:hypothetical protein
MQDAMDRFTARRLAHADRQIVEGIGLAIKQREIIFEMERIGVDASKSKGVLEAFLSQLRELIDYRDKLLRELDA